MDYETAPDYLKAADLHNIGAGNDSFFSNPIEQTVDFVSKIPSFAITSVASGVNSIYNSGVVAGNFFGLTDAKENDLRQTLSSYDTDLGKYYADHQQATDLAGFIAGSLVPGTLGIKLFNTGQKMLSVGLKTGSMGRTIAQSTGLIETVTADGFSLAQVAGKALAEGQQTFTLMNAGVLKAVGAGFVQATLESAAFETMVAATMFRSPVLEGADFADISKNILTGALLGGAIGGALNVAKTSGIIKKEITAIDLKEKPFTLRSDQSTLTSPADKIIVATHDLQATPVANGAREEALSTTRIQTIKNEVRTNIHSLTGKDSELGNTIADILDGLPANQISNVMQGAKQIVRPGYSLTVAEGQQVGYVRLHGEGVGDVTFDGISKAEQTLADKLISKEQVDSFVASAKFTPGKNWTMVTASSSDEIEARYIWAETKALYKEGMTIHSSDIPLLEGALKKQLNEIKVTDGVHEYSVGIADLQNEILQAKKDLAAELIKAKRAPWQIEGENITSGQIARMVNTSKTFLESTEGASAFARQDAQSMYNEVRKAKGLSGEVDLNYVPQHMQVVYDTKALANASPDLTGALVNIKQQQKVARDSIDTAFSGLAGDLAERFVRPGDAAILESNRYGAGAGLVTFANGTYGSLASWAENAGKATADLISKLRGNTAAVTDSASLRLRNNQAAAIEFDKINNLVASTTEKYVLNEAGDGLIAKKTLAYRNDVKAGKKGTEVPTLQVGAPEEIKFVSQDTGEAIIARMELNGNRVTHTGNLRAAQGLEDSRDASVYYPIKPQPKDFPFFAFVKDETVTGAGAGHTSMLHATTDVELQELIKMTQAKTGFKVYTKTDAEKFYKAQSEYEFDRTLHDNYIDSSLKSKGVNSQFFPKTDPDKIVESWLANEQRADSSLAREAVTAKFGGEFDQLESLGQQYTNVGASRYGVSAKSIESTVQNPYNDYRKTALNISRLSEYPLLTAFNRNLETKVSSVYQKIKDTWNETSSVNSLEAVNKLLEEAGVSHAYKSAAEIILANHTAPKPYLSNFIRGANSILANTFLRIDPLNALNNAIGAQVLLGHETSGLVKDTLRKAQGLVVPGAEQSGSKILSPAALIGKANVDFFSGSPELVAQFKANGWLTKISDQYKSMLDDITLQGTEDVGRLNSKLQSALDKAKELSSLGEKLTGNKLAEEYNRFVAAHVGKQISDTQIGLGLMTLDAQPAFINTFVNRTQGNILASQRPLIFQGPVGQAVGLFQTFQFNTLQQLFRGVAEGGPKDAAMLLGLQGTMYGLNGLPAFQFINQHIVGTASGNKNHTDAYSSLYGAAGKTAGDWLMYGVPSNLLQTNLYTRGDINPRNLLVIPTAPQDIVAVSAFGKFAGNFFETVSKMAGGGNVWQSFLQGIEHNSLSRPLAGMAQTLQAVDGGKVFSTTNKGDLSFANDLLSVATLSRLAGGKPLDEALANDEISRSIVYKAADKKRMDSATEIFKTTIVGDTSGNVTDAAVGNYLNAFVRNGGRAEDFNKVMGNIIMKVNTPKANQVMSSLKGPYAEHMKSLMGGNISTILE